MPFRVEKGVYVVHKKNCHASFRVYVLPVSRTLKKRFNLMLDPILHAWAVDEADRQGKSFSAYVSDLLERESKRASGEVTMTVEERVNLRREIAEEVLQSLAKRRRV